MAQPEGRVTPYHQDPWLTVYQGDCREVMASMEPQSVHCVVTSPPYWGLRDYGIGGQLGLEPTPEEYVANMVAVFRAVRRVLRDDGTVWLNLGDSYATSNPVGRRDNGREVDGRRVGTVEEQAGSYDVNVRRAARRWGAWDALLKPKDLVGIPWRVAFALQADGWYLRSDIIWAKPNPMPESVADRPTKSHEYVFLLSKSARYWFDAEAVREPHEAPRAIGRHMATNAPHGPSQRPVFDRRVMPDPAGRNIRSVWTVATQPYPGAHFATFPEKLVEPCIKAGCPELGTVLDPFAGSGTTGRVAQRLSRRAVLIDLNGEYLVQAMDRNRDLPLGLESA